MIRVETNSAAETEALGELLSKHLKKGDVIALSGELAAGKTKITQGICKGLNVEEQVESPTFTLVNEYHGDLKVFHIDCYREHRIDEWIEIGIDEYLFNEGVSIVEWAEQIEKLLPDNLIWISLEHLQYTGTKRLISVKATSELEILLEDDLKRLVKT